MRVLQLTLTVAALAALPTATADAQIITIELAGSARTQTCVIDRSALGRMR
ncbi:MAG: hypothetical protein ACRD15_09660 [Vicinamibacterales bacterium]